MVIIRAINVAKIKITVGMEGAFFIIDNLKQLTTLILPKSENNVIETLINFLQVYNLLILY